MGTSCKRCSRHGRDGRADDARGELPGYDVLVLTPYRVSPEQAKRVRAFVESGGGLLAAATGWGWQSGSKKPMAEFPGNLLLAGSGLAWTDGFARTTTPDGYTAGGEISPFVNAALALERIAGRPRGQPERACDAAWRASA